MCSLTKNLTTDYIDFPDYSEYYKKIIYVIRSIKNFFKVKYFLFFFLILILFQSELQSQIIDYNDSIERNAQFNFWAGPRSKMTALEIASYCAPVFWFSSDEPELHNKKGKEINIPRPYPFDSATSKPVVYYQIKNLLVKKNVSGQAYIPDKENKNNSIIDLSMINGFEINYTHYYEFEAGLGAHRHDNEQVQFKVYVEDDSRVNGLRIYEFVLLEVKAKAHALSWYDNTYVLDTTTIETKLPFHILVEEGKHASCTDVNADGYYTPGYDVNVSINDAWGLRDVIRTGGLFTSDYQGWMSKPRKPEYSVLPPLPKDSPYYKKFIKDSIYSPDNAVYELRPMPPLKNAGKDLLLKNDMSAYVLNHWPDFEKDSDTRRIINWWQEDRLLKSVSVAARYDKNLGISVSFPLLIFKNVEAPIVNGWLVNKVYWQDFRSTDFGYSILYTSSASRFLDPYFSAGIEINKTKDEQTDSFKRKTEFVVESGLKFRANLKYSFLKFLSFLTDFWGIRIGVKNTGFSDIKRLNYVLEVGAGVW